MSGKMFSTPEEEIKFWREKAEKFKTDLEETKEDFEEFQISSRELEQELETQVEQLENTKKDLTTKNTKLQNDVDSLREKLGKLQGSSHYRTTELEDELTRVTAIKDDLQKYIRELEQANDDLERAKRETIVSLEDFEFRLTQSVERNVYLESELDEKETLVETVQRLKDEAKDLREELGVATAQGKDVPKPEIGQIPRLSDLAKSGCTDLQASIKSPQVSIKSPQVSIISPQGSIISPQVLSTPSPTSGSYQIASCRGTPLTPSSRIAALNVVSDLLRKVSALEAKLDSYRRYRHVKDEPRNVKPGGCSPMNSPWHED